MEILGGGDPRHLRKYLQVIAIADEPRVRELHHQTHERYREMKKIMAKTSNRSRHHERGMDDPERSLSR